MTEVDRFLHWLVDNRGLFVNIDDAVKEFQAHEDKTEAIKAPHDYYNYCGSDEPSYTLKGWKGKVVT